MRLPIILAAAVAGWGALGAALPCYAEDSTKEFFNGKDLSGWEGLTEYWSVKDGALIGSTPAPDGVKFNTFLCSKKPYRDFELSFQVRLKGGEGNSGVQIRSKIHEPGKAQFAVAGPQ